jgi:DNA invertase Pin-like site-specific DNA recombinase
MRVDHRLDGSRSLRTLWDALETILIALLMRASRDRSGARSIRFLEHPARWDQKSKLSFLVAFSGITGRLIIRSMTTAIGYVRVSTNEQAREGFSLDAQRRRIESYCEAQSWQLLRIYADEGISGSAADRPAFRDLLSDAVTTGLVDKIVFLKLDRLGRKALTLLDARERLEARNVGIVSITEHFDTSTSIGRFFWTMLAAFAELERDLIRERTSSGRQEKARRGQGWVSGRPPFGYRCEGGELIVEPAAAETVRLIFHTASTGESADAIARGLTAAGIASPGGSVWEPLAVRRILRNPVYRGEYSYAGHKVSAPPIVSPRVWRRAQGRGHA